MHQPPVQCSDALEILGLQQFAVPSVNGVSIPLSFQIIFEFAQIYLPITFIRKHFQDMMQLRC
jgi:hypothetical protein